jgi:multiple sugar transport system permease protein
MAGRLLLAALVLVVFAFPFYWVVVTSLDTNAAVFAFPPHLWPSFDLSNYVRALGEAPWLRFFLNTVFIATATTFMVLVTSILAGFAFGVLDFPGRSLLFAAFLSVMMIPQTVLLIPDYIILNDLHWLNTYWAQIVPWGASVFGIFLLRQVFMSLPRELLDAAELDGAGRARFLWHVVVPIARPALITVGLYVFIGAWNSFLWPYIMTTSPSVQPIEVGLAAFLGAEGTDWTGLSAAVVFTTLPVMVLFLAAQRQFLEGASSVAAGMKG